MGVHAGELVDGRYLLSAQLGEGTFGDVWRAQDTRLSGRAVAVKFLKPEFVSQAEAVARFEAEADALAQVQHPNVVAVHDRGRWEGRHFLVTEFVEGATLAAWIESFRERGVYPDMATTLALFDQLCAGMEAAHAVRVPGPIVHRDLKPENVLLKTQPDGSALAKVLDFGIAQLGRRGGTMTGALLGTPLYMAPEQALGNTAAVGPWTDVFAIGVIATEMLTLRAQVDPSAPWWGTALARGGEVRALLGALRADVPAALWDVIAAALAREAADRPRDAGVMRAMVRRAGGLVTALGSTATAYAAPQAPAMGGAVPRTVVSAPPPSPGPATTAPLERAARAAAAPNALPTRAALGASVVLGIVAVVMTARGRRPETPPSSAASAASGATAPVPPTTAPTSTTPPGATTVSVGRSMGEDPPLLAFFRQWNAAVIDGRGTFPLDPFYIDRVQFRRSGGRASAADIARYFAAHADVGGTFAIDWSRSEWVEEDLASPDAPRACTELPGATGPIVKVRAWATEYTRDRAGGSGGDVPCDTLAGRYLFRVRRVAGELRICHETWSLREGVCASCPAARACARLGPV